MARHHYVPRFYLRPWCGADSHIHVCRRKLDGTLEQKRRALRGTGYVDDLYKREPEIKGLGNDKWADFVEKEYSKLESKAARVRDKLLSGSPPSALDPSERETWAAFIATLEHRSPRKVQEIESEARAHVAEYTEQLKARAQDLGYAERVTASINTDAVAANAARTTPLQFLDRLLQPLFDLQWAMITITDGIEFITADYPIAYLQHEGQRVLTCLPISPSKVFVAGATEFSAWDSELIIMMAMSVNLQIISQGPNCIYSASRLEDGAIFRLKKAALDCLPKSNTTAG